VRFAKSRNVRKAAERIPEDKQRQKAKQESRRLGFNLNRTVVVLQQNKVRVHLGFDRHSNVRLVILGQVDLLGSTAESANAASLLRDLARNRSQRAGTSNVLLAAARCLGGGSS
jgi:hypothetical protein